MDTTTRTARLLAPFLPVLTAVATFGACRVDDADPRPGAGPAAHETETPRADPALALTLERATVLADSIEDLLRPVPLMRPAQEEVLRRYPNARHVERARQLGIRPADSAGMAALVAEGRLVRLEDSTDHWVVRELGASRPYVTPDTRALLVRLGEAFQRRLDRMGLPPYRFEVSSVLRTAASQAALRQRNENAAAGTSAHEFGTTVDVAYSGYAAPADLPSGLIPADAPDPTALEAVARAVLERMAARKSRELQAILGEVVTEAQDRGDVARAPGD
ncbi:MAG: DUF5715 family protein [Gemmatimonadota bacterium]